MSTRCQLRFIQRIASNDDAGGADGDVRVAQLYRHADGYPEAVIQALTRLHQLLEATRSVRGPSYAAAQFLFLDKLSSIAFYLNRDTERRIHAEVPADVLDIQRMVHLDQPLFLLGHGVEDPADGIHGDEEYLYEVELPAREPFDQPAPWTIRVSEHCGFPRWDGPTDSAFERATWQFDGYLDDAVETLVVEPP